MDRKYTVVENAGYEGECDITSRQSYWDALKWLEDHYDDSEIERLHIDIACDLPDGTRTYDI